MSQIVVHNGIAYLAGQIADDPSGSIEAQTASVLAKVDRLLQQAGSSRSNLLSVQVFLPHITDFDAMNGIYDSWIDPKAPPARACIEARLADARLRIEVTAIAAVSAET
jgi:enamine deaminase RidA (YjgF/YER057c/UK114 family)